MAMDGNDRFNTRVIHGTPYPTDTAPNANEPNTWSWAVLNRSGVALLGNDPIQGNTPFQFQDRATFSPWPSNILSPETVLLGAILYKILKEKPEMFERLAKQYMASVTDMVNHIADAGKAHPFNHLNSTTLTAAVLHRAGLITNGGYIKVIDQTRSIIDKLIQLNFGGLAVEGLQTLVEGTKAVAGTSILPTESYAEQFKYQAALTQPQKP